MKRLVLLLLVCAAPVIAQDRSADLRAAAGCGPRATEFSVKVDKNQHVVKQPEPGKALVYVIAQESPGRRELWTVLPLVSVGPRGASRLRRLAVQPCVKAAAKRSSRADC